MIELDGDSHASNEAAAYDQQRTQVLAGYGLKVIRFTNDEVFNDFEGVCERIGALIDPPYPP